MNRTEFMGQLEFLLRNVSDGEREEALQYYNDYFDDAGAENEQAVIEALGNPGRVAENIRRELSENQGIKRATAADRAVVEYGNGFGGQTADGQPDGGQIGGLPAAFQAAGKSPTAAEESTTAYFDTTGGTSGGGEPGPAEKKGMSAGLTVLIAVLAVFAAPFIIGLLAMLFGLLVMWLALIFSFGIVVLVMFILLFFLLIVGGMCISVDPLAGMAVMGGGLICGGVGLLFLMLTAAMTGIVTPAMFRGIGRLFHYKRKEARA